MLWIDVLFFFIVTNHCLRPSNAIWDEMGMVPRGIAYRFTCMKKASNFNLFTLSSRQHCCSVYTNTMFICITLVRWWMKRTSKLKTQAMGEKSHTNRVNENKLICLSRMRYEKCSNFLFGVARQKRQISMCLIRAC